MLVTIEMDSLKDFPKGCYECPFGIMGEVWKCQSNKWERFTYACFITGKVMTSTKRNRYCPLKEIRNE